jgi:hypothetical protein
LPFEAFELIFVKNGKHEPMSLGPDWARQRNPSLKNKQTNKKTQKIGNKN